MQLLLFTQLKRNGLGRLIYIKIFLNRYDNRLVPNHCLYDYLDLGFNKLKLIL